MTQTFYGKWTVEVMSHNGGFQDRFIISGATTGNGTYMATVGTSVQVDGLKWQLAAEWASFAVPGWHPGHDRRVGADFLLDAGLVVTIGAARAQDFTDLVLRCRNLDPKLNSFIPVTNLPDFT